jgi:hypothetical protein
MKYIAFTVLVLALLAAICIAVLWTKMPTAKLTVYPVRLLGTNVSWPSLPGPQQQWLPWEFAIKNSGRAPAQWAAHVHFKDGEHEWAENAEWVFDPSHGFLQPGETATIKVGVLQDSRTIWSVTVGYHCVESDVERTLHGWFRPIPKLRRLLPNDDYHYAADVWHHGTNVVTAR